MKYLVLLMSILLCACSLHAQQIQLYVEDFENGFGQFVLDSNSFGPQTGPNTWIVNDEYDGQGVYPNTTRQDSTTSGTIGGAPFSNYLHIHDTVTRINQNIANANYDNSSPSDRFVFTGDGFCTLGLTDIIFTFFYVVEGDTFNANSYGEVYYSINQGPWIQVGDPKYYAQSKWKYEIITDPAFANQENLRFGFRWVNDDTSPNTISFSIDDIIAVGTYDTINSSVDITVPTLFSTLVCPLDNLVIQWDLSGPLCDGIYEVEMSNNFGNFNFGVTNLGVFNIASLDTVGFIAVQIPRNTPAGTCYRLRINRVSPQPIITGLASICFEVETCPNTIETLDPVVATDPDTVCSLSAIDVPFISRGIYNGNNVYTAELSDSSGSFANPLVIGTLPSSETFDPAIGAMPGNVSGLIPSVPAGCNYFIRVVSSSPQATGTTFGPFCINQCDMLTNNTIDIQICIMETSGVDTTIDVNINWWDSTTTYDPNNVFSLELRDMMFFSRVDSGSLALKFDTTSGALQLIVPGLNDLLNLGIAPGAYYGRILASSSSAPWDERGTIIRITIGAPADSPPDIIVNPGLIICNSTGFVSYFVDPLNPNSQYEWFSASLVGSPFFRAPPLLVDFTGAPVDDYTVRVREVNFGCAGPISGPATINVITTPVGDVDGPTLVCLGDTVTYTVPFLAGTFYDWTDSDANIIDTSNNEVTVVFDSAGIYRMSNFALNDCGQRIATLDVEVISLLEAKVEPEDTSVCAGQPLTFTATTEGFQKTLLTTTQTDNNPQTGVQGFMFNVVANANLDITAIAINFQNAVPADIEVYTKAGSFVGFEQDQAAWTLAAGATSVVPNPTGTLTDLNISPAIPLAGGDTTALYVTATNGARFTYKQGNNIDDLVVGDRFLEILYGTYNFGPFAGATPVHTFNGTIAYLSLDGLQYQWSTGDTTETIDLIAAATDNITVRISDTSGCGNDGNATLTVFPLPAVDAGMDATICLGETFTIQANADGSFTWEPDDGLPNPSGLVNTISPDSTVTYILNVSDTSNNCKNADTVIVIVDVESSTTEVAELCPNQPLELAMPEVSGATYSWSTGETSRTIIVSAPGNYRGILNDPANQCSDEFIFTVAPDDCAFMLDVPDAFTPNGDGTNDYFTVFGDGVSAYEILIYNRWGELVYQSDDVTELGDLNRGWDGRYKGEPQSTGTFVYLIKAKDLFNESVTKKGNLTLIR